MVNNFGHYPAQTTVKRISVSAESHNKVSECLIFREIQLFS